MITMPILRFHWDFLGPDAQITAAHFCKHVKEFCETNDIDDPHVFSAMVNGNCVASLECDEKHLLLVRDKLRPKRAERLLEP